MHFDFCWRRTLKISWNAYRTYADIFCEHI